MTATIVERDIRQCLLAPVADFAGPYVTGIEQQHTDLRVAGIQIRQFARLRASGSQISRTARLPEKATRTFRSPGCGRWIRSSSVRDCLDDPVLFSAIA